MLTAKALEAKVLEKISAALPQTLPSHIVVGLWQPTATGVLKDVEVINGQTAVIEVTTTLGRRPLASVSTVSFTVTVNLMVRLEIDTQGQHLLDFSEPLDSLFDGWMAACYQQPFTDLDISGLSIDGVGVDGGRPSLDTTAKVGRVLWTIELSGSYQPATNN